MIERMSEHLDLDDTQRQTVENILEAAKPEIEALRDRAKASREAMRELEVDDPNRSSIINNIALENGQIATEGTLLFDRVHSEVLAVLTDEQRQMLEEKKSELKERFENRRQKGRRGERRGGAAPSE